MTCIAPASVRTTQTNFAFSKNIPPGRKKNFWNNAQPIRAAQSIVTFHPLQNKMPCHFSPYKNESEKWQIFLIGNDRTPESRALTLYLKAPRAIMAKTKNDYFGLGYILSLILCIIPVTNLVCSVITRIMEGKILAAILRIVLGWNIIWIADIISMIFRRRIIRVINL